MTSALDRPDGSDEFSPYAPKRIREAAQAATHSGRSPRLESSKDDKRFESAPPAGVSDDSLVNEDFDLPLSLMQTPSSKPLAVRSFRSVAYLLRRPASAVPILASVTFFAVGAPLPVLTSSSNKSASELSQASSPTVGQTAANAADANPRGAKLFVEQAPARKVGEAIPLGISVRDLDQGGLVVVSGFADGTTLSAGKPIAKNNWWLSAADLEHAVVQPPPHFVGAMDVTVELRLADTALRDRRTLRFEWVDAAPAEAKPKSDAARSFAPDEIAAMLKRGDDLIASGDLAAAQLVLRPAAEAGDARAAMTLAGTYDPMTLEKLGVHGFSADVALARHWYEKAKQLGSPDASRRLEMLASGRQ